MGTPKLEYTCANCGGTFVSDRPDADAAKEYKEVFSAEMRAGQTPLAVCDDCYRKMIAKMPPSEAWVKSGKPN